MNKKTLLTLSLTATLAACGGGSDETAGRSGSLTGVSGVITAVNPGSAGTVAALVGTTSSTTLTVNGAEYALAPDATIDMDDAVGSESDLAEGQVVDLDVTDNGDGTYSVSMVEFDDEVEGYVVSADLADDGSGAFVGTLNVMGKLVHVSASTVYEGGDLNKATIDLVGVGDIVEVSGYPDANGDVLATRIEGKGAGEDVQVKGLVSDLTETTFNLGRLTVDFGSATLDLSDAPLDTGLYVEVKADSAPTDLDGDGTYVLLATHVELQDDGDMEDDSLIDGDQVEIAGVLVVDGATGAISVNGQGVVAGAGITEGQLAALEGKLVVVEGYMQTGSLVVVEVEGS